MLRYVIDGLSRADLRAVARSGAVANASVTRWQTNNTGSLVLAEYNRTAHLR